MVKVDKKIVMSIDCAISDYLKTEGITREAMAERMHMSSNSLRWKREGKYDWSWSEILKLSELMGCSIDDLTNYEAVSE